MKKLGFALLIFAIVMSGCHQQGTAWSTGLYEPYRIADANIPFADNLHTSQFDRVVELERDDYGRGYYLYKTNSRMLGSGIEIHIISQPTKDDRVYYYPDVCYLIYSEGDAAISDAEVAEFKNQNDWNLPLVEEKMYGVSYSEAIKDLAYEEELCAAVLQYFELDEELYGAICNGLEIVKGYKQLIAVMVVPRDQGANTFEDAVYYLMVYTNTAKQPIIECQQIDPKQNLQEQIISVREEWLTAG